ncbi:Membrane assembly protein AsmA [Paramixta manurensis]|uniref:Membrane assembly protein AsmA n=1 Tax=Paramixta manurensis TaxID=2740817 RepID=A0A6M8URQ1_9GAMM|nr:Membrane assembly protein AsmA [Erwiniaceae bacterium PD-1]
MRRLITTLAILLVVVVAGMTALVLLVNPNDFRAYMVQQVEQRSGYQLHLEGSLRWHVWPQLSILAGRMSVTAPGAHQPLVTAENMRLDVNLLPLLSHQLSVKQVLLKNAVVRVTADSETQKPENAPVGPRDSSTPEAISGWKFDIGKLQVVDSLLVWQPPGGEEITFRDLNLDMEQSDRKQANLEVSTRVNRDQRKLQLSLKGAMDVSEYPHRLSGKIDELTYQLNGADLPTQGIQGDAVMSASWDNDAQRFTLSDLQLKANESQLNGTLSGTLGTKPQIEVALHSPRLDFDKLLGISSDNAAGQVGGAAGAGISRAPVIAERTEHDNANNPLNFMVASLKMRLDALRWRGVELQNVTLDAQNQQGLLAINTFSGQQGKGRFSLPGSVDVRAAQTQVNLRPDLQDIALSPLLKAFALPDTVDGLLSLQGVLQGEGLSVDAFRQVWQGRASVALTNARFAGLNFQQMIQRAVERNSGRVSGDDAESNDTQIERLQGSTTLNHGTLSLTQLEGNSSRLNLTGGGAVDMAKQQCDITFNIKVTAGWKGDDALVETLRQTAVPLRIYGSWDSLQYSLQVDQLLRKRVQDAAKSRLNQWVDRHPDNNKANDVKKLLKQP